MAPTLSDDVYRYRWEGMVQAEGANPYDERPNDRKWDRLRDEVFLRIPTRDFKTGYGPLIELIQAGTYPAGGGCRNEPNPAGAVV